MLNPGDTIGIIACSDGRPLSMKSKIDLLTKVLTGYGLSVLQADTIYQKNNTLFSGTPKERGRALMELFTNPKVKAIFDISGGDSANQVLPELDYQQIKQNPKPFFGHSDLSVILNTLYTKADLPTYHYQILHLVGDNAEEQQERFQNLITQNHPNNLTFDYHWIREQQMGGVVIGGNIRCFLKLAGTTYLPNPAGKILFLESLGGDVNRIASLLAQLDQIGYFNQCAGILLGTFTELEKKNESRILTDIVKEVTNNYQMPIAKTQDLGHGPNSHCIPIGKRIEF